MGPFFRRLLALFRRDHLDRDLEEEMRLHLEMKADEAGDPASARRSFGNPLLLREQSKDLWAWRWLDALARDMRYALRTLRRSPGFVAVAVTTLALGIGLNLAVFALIYKIVLRPVDYRGVDRLMDVHLIFTEERRGTIPMTWSYPKFQELLRWNRSFETLTALQRSVLTLSEVEDRFTAEIVSANYFRMIGVNAQRGRVFVDEDDTPTGAGCALLISDALWRGNFGADPGAVGRTLRLNGVPMTIVGVLPPGFKGETGRTEAWATMAAYLTIDPNPGRGAHNLQAIGRLKAGVSPKQADEDVRRVVARMERDHPSDRTSRTKWTGGARPLLEARVDPRLRKVLWTLQAATACVLLIACVNLANLLIGRGAARRRELATRLALGTGRMGLMRQMLVEPVLLALAGGTAGLLLAAGGVRALAHFLPSAGWNFLSSGYTRFIDPATLRLELPLVLGGVLLALATGIVFGLLPAWQAMRADLSQGIRSGLDVAGPAHLRLRNGLVAAQMALALVLLASADLMIRSFAALVGTDFGVETRNILTLNVQPRIRDLSARRVFYGELERRVGALPGVESAALSSVLPAFGPDEGTVLRIDGRGSPIETGVFQTSPTYFRLFQVPVLAGRVFTDADREDRPRVVVLSDSAARRFFPGENPVGRRIEYPHAIQNLAEVVGVVGDVKYGPPEERTRPVVYSSTLQNRPGSFLVVRAAHDPRPLIPALRQTVRALDREARVYDVRTIADIVAQATWRARLAAVLLGLMAALSLALAAVGVYGVFTYAVAARYRDFGVRLALGAGRSRILRMVLREGAVLSSVSLAVGLPFTFVLTRLLSSQLYRVSSADPLAYSSAIMLLVAVAMLACYLPARRATRIDPMEALRHE
ncbi:MAG: ADOP family duplicated permease [Bryobacteraceae bacterium]